MESNGQIYPDEKKKPDLTVIEGGLPRFKLDGKDGDGGAWLLTINPGSWFLAASMSTNQIGLLAFQLVDFTPQKKAAQLFSAGEHMWVDVNRFSSTHKFIEVIKDGKDERDRPNNTG